MQGMSASTLINYKLIGSTTTQGAWVGFSTERNQTQLLVIHYPANSNIPDCIYPFDKLGISYNSGSNYYTMGKTSVGNYDINLYRSGNTIYLSTNTTAASGTLKLYAIDTDEWFSKVQLIN